MDNSYWNGYRGQPIVLFMLFDMNNREIKLDQLKKAGSHSFPIVDDFLFDEDDNYKTIRYKDCLITDLFHSIVITKYTPEEYCQGVKRSRIRIREIRNKYDILDLR